MTVRDRGDGPGHWLSTSVAVMSGVNTPNCRIVRSVAGFCLPPPVNCSASRYLQICNSSQMWCPRSRIPCQKPLLSWVYESSADVAGGNKNLSTAKQRKTSVIALRSAFRYFPVTVHISHSLPISIIPLQFTKQT